MESELMNLARQWAASADDVFESDEALLFAFACAAVAEYSLERKFDDLESTLSAIHENVDSLTA